MMLPRRQFLYLSVGAAALSGPFSALAQLSDTRPQPTQAERAAMSDLARAFMEKYAVPGFSIAVGHGGTIVYQDAFGWADQGNKEAVSPENLFRIASVTKTITSVTIFSLIEQGHITLTDKVFGPSAITGTDYGHPPTIRG
ncbi:MAG: serine hydrolase [Xanthobacteraceae bacterium]|nr:serine hydrolase [Xanthobacteraceae bacterium]